MPVGNALNCTNPYLWYMKSLLTFLLLASAFVCHAQKMLVPYRSGNLFGLSDENGKITVTPQFDHVEWMEDNWFRTSKKIQLKDTLEIAPGRHYIRNTTAKLSGLIHQNTIVLKDEPFDDYEIVAKKCIVTEYEGRGEDLTKEQFKKYGNHRRLYCLFNLEGKNLHPDNFRRIQKVDTAGISSKDKKTARYILFIVTQLDEKHSMFVFDADQQKISDWLVKDAFKIEGDRKRIFEKQISFNITDKNAISITRVLDYTSGKFVLTAAPSTPAPKKKELIEQVEVVELGTGGFSDPPAIPMEEGKIQRSTKPSFNPYYIFARDTLYYLTSYQDKHPVKLQPGGKIFLTEPRGMTQYQPVIVKSGGQFYIVKEDKLSTASYDSLIYFGTNFLAWQKINGQTKAGVINADGAAVIPMEYDSIYADIKYFNLKDKTPARNTSTYEIELTEADSKYNYNKPYPYKRAASGFLTVFKNGKCGVITIKGETVVPVQYELIARNNLQHSRPRVDEFLLLKQNNKYGIATLQWSKEKKRSDLFFTVAPTFDFIPAFYYPDYYGVKNFKLIGLYNDQMQFKGYATESGKLFYKD